MPLVMAVAMEGVRKPVIEEMVLEIPLSEPARFGAMSCSPRREPLVIAPMKPTDRHSVMTAATLLHLTHIIAIRHIADMYKP